MALLEIDDLTKAFGGLRAVDKASFTVEEGAIVSLIGPNGAGKTTVFNLVSGTLGADAGRVAFRGEDLVGLRPHKISRLGISRTFQITRELGDMSLLENMVVQSPAEGVRALFGRSMLRRERDRAHELLDFVGLSDLAESPAKHLSYGQRKLLEFTSTLMSDPDLVLLDEPAAGINPALLDRMVDYIVELNSSGLTFMLIEHNIDLVMELSDSVVVMASGEVLTQGPPEVVQEDETVLDAYLGAV